MIRYKKNTYPPITLGTSLMFIIFIILCMVLFSVLSLSNAIKDQHYSLKNAERTHAYYEANNKAEEYLYQIDSILSDASSPDVLKDRLQDLNFITIATWDEFSDKTLSYTIAINDREALEVVLAIHPQKETNYTILSWNQISVYEWDSHSTLPVYGNN